MNIHLLTAQAKKSLEHIRHEGLGSFLKILERRLKSSRSLLTKPDILHAYRFLSWTPRVLPLDDDLAQGRRTINWYIPPIGKGSGGHLNIFRFMAYLGQQGFINRVVVVDDESHLSIAQVQAQIQAWFGVHDVKVFYIDHVLPSATFSVATSWQTAYAVRNLAAATHKCYFVQDYEPWFYPAGTEQALAEQTYGFGFQGFTAGSWLARRLADEFAMPTSALGFSYDRALYRVPSAGPRGPGKRVFFYVRPPTARRAFDLGVLVLAELNKRIQGLTVVMAGWNVQHYALPFDCEHAGLCEPSELAALYGSCDAALVLSFSNLSLLPLEIMACGVPVISNRADCTMWLLNDDIAMLAEPSIDGLAKAIAEVLDSPERARQLRQNGLAFTASTDWSKEGLEMAKKLDEIIATGSVVAASD